MSRNRAKPRAPGEPRPDRHVAARMLGHELAGVDRAAALAGLSRSAFMREVLLAHADAGAVFEARIEALEAQVRGLEDAVVTRTNEVRIVNAATHALVERHAREVVGLRHALDLIDSEAQRRRQQEYDMQFYYG